MRVLFDTNVLFSSILFGGLPRRLFLDAVVGRLVLVSSPFLLDELERKLVEKGGFTRQAAILARREIEMACEVVEPGEVARVVRDPDDDHVLAAAVAGRVDVVVTGDSDLLDLGSHRGIPILTPRGLADLPAE